MQLQQAQDIFVLHRVAQRQLDLVRELIDLAQIAQIKSCRLVEDLEQEPRFFERAEQLCSLFVEFAQYGRFLQADGDDVLRRQDDRKRQRVVASLSAHDRNIGQDEDRVVLHVNVGTLLIVKRGAEKVGLDLGALSDDLQLVRRRINDIDPCSFFERLERELNQRPRL